MNIELKQITFSNFLSYENGSYDFSNGIDLIVGKNGSGKSTTIDAIFFALFGKPYRKVKLNSLINKVKGKKLLVQLHFNIDDKQYKIIRAIKPNKFEIYEFKDEWSLILEQASTKDYQKFLEEEILKINETIFRQLISISANLPNSKPFMELNTNEKEELFQIITDTSIFGDIKVIFSSRIREKKAELKDQEYKRIILDNSIQSESLTIESAEKRNLDFQNHHNENIRMVLEHISVAESTIEKYKEGLKKLKEIKEKYDEKIVIVQDYNNKINDILPRISKIKSKIQYIKDAQSGAIQCKDCNSINYLVQVNVNEKDDLIQ
jgi:DNA repair exonuclease SbcCD ATPase subunit